MVQPADLRREWALIVPSWIMVGFLVAYFGYINLTIYLIPPFDSITTIRGELARITSG